MVLRESTPRLEVANEGIEVEEPPASEVEKEMEKVDIVQQSVDGR